MSTLLLRLLGPMQSWGSHSRFSERDTEREPTKSAVIGLICAALGKPREEEEGDGYPTLEALAAMPMGIRVEREGRLERDYHTSGGGEWPGLPSYGVRRADPSKKSGETVLSNRYYLSDAVFLVGFEGEETLLRRIHESLRAPRWPLALGRKAFPPSEPVWLPDGLRVGEGLEEALRAFPSLCPIDSYETADERRLRLVLETKDVHEGELRMDVPLCFESRNRRFARRYVKSLWMDAASLVTEGREA